MERRGARGRWRGWALGLAVALVAALGATQLVRGQTPASLRPAIDARHPGTRWIDTRTLARSMARPAAEQPILLDVREAPEFAVSHLRGARRVDPALADAATLHLAPSAPVVVYCSVGYRSAAIIPRLRVAGVRDVRNLAGGIFQWANEGRPLYRGTARVHLVHPYDRLWAALLREDLRSPL